MLLIATFALLAVVAGYARSDPLTHIALALGLASLFLGEDVWQSWRYYSRPLLLAHLFPMIAIGSRISTTVRPGAALTPAIAPR